MTEHPLSRDVSRDRPVTCRVMSQGRGRREERKELLSLISLPSAQGQSEREKG